jgi:hypothetical protein
MSMSTPPPGWYSDPEVASGERYWHGDHWGPERRERAVDAVSQPPPPPVPQAASGQPSGAWAVAISLALGVIGLVVGYQPVTLLSGSGILYVGLALAAGGVVLAFAMHLRTWLKIVTAIAVLLVVANIVTVEHSLSQKRHEIQNELSNLG